MPEIVYHENNSCPEKNYHPLAFSSTSNSSAAGRTLKGNATKSFKLRSGISRPRFRAADARHGCHQHRVTRLLHVGCQVASLFRPPSSTVPAPFLPSLCSNYPLCTHSAATGCHPSTMSKFKWPRKHMPTPLP
jgi:hypothetical protein